MLVELVEVLAAGEAGLEEAVVVEEVVEAFPPAVEAGLETKFHDERCFQERFKSSRSCIYGPILCFGLEVWCKHPLIMNKDVLYAKYCNVKDESTKVSASFVTISFFPTPLLVRLVHFKTKYPWFIFIHQSRELQVFVTHQKKVRKRRSKICSIGIALVFTPWEVDILPINKKYLFHQPSLVIRRVHLPCNSGKRFSQLTF